MNLSCGKCKQIQPFSGQPPACDVCGWVPSSDPPNNAWLSSNTGLVRIISVIVTMAFVSLGGGTAIWKYLQRHVSREKLTIMHYHGEWSPGEYRECTSMNSKEEGSKPELDCVGSSMMNSDKIKMFNVNFSGDLTYDSEKQSDLVHYWFCRNNATDDPAFSCSARVVERTENQTTPAPSAERQLTSDEIEYFRKQNECRQRFYNRQVFQIGEMSIGEACRQNPDRQP